jgi:hypothetical protein
MRKWGRISTFKIRSRDGCCYRRSEEQGVPRAKR